MVLQLVLQLTLTDEFSTNDEKTFKT